ncbi:MAG: endonuclease, partial [Pseudomonadota bacterium]
MLAEYVVRSFSGAETPSETQLRERMTRFVPVLAAIDQSVSAEEQVLVVKELLARLRVSMDVGTSLKEVDVEPWLDSRRSTIDPFYWTRFANHLQRDWAPGVLRNFDRTTDEILDLCGNPADTRSWNRRGLVIGDVQSGKTATYTALCCKAADAGYQAIVLLTGTLESLRRQTQQRLDEGFAGLDSSEYLPSGKVAPKNRAIGAGLSNQSRFAAVFTSRTRDFSKDVLNSHQLTLRAVKEPVLFVVKKHKSIIENLATWLQSYNSDNDGRISESLLLID